MPFTRTLFYVSHEKSIVARDDGEPPFALDVTPGGYRVVSYSQLWNMDLSRLDSAASASGNVSGVLSGRGGEVASKADIPSGMWKGADADAASGLLSPQANPLWDASDAFNGAQGVLEELSESMNKAKERLADAHDAVAGTAAYITADGSVVVPPGLEDDERKRAKTAAMKASEIIDEALSDADAADSRAGGALVSQSTQANIFTNPYMQPYIKDTPLDPQWWKGVGQAGQDWAKGVWDAVADEAAEDWGWDGPSVSKGDDGWSWNLFNADGKFKGDLGPFDVWGGPSAGIGGDLGAHNSVEAQAGVGAGIEKGGSAEGGPFTVKGSAGVEVGARAGAGLEFGMDDGKFVAGGHAKATAGVGGSLSGGIEVDVDKLKDSWNDFSDKLVPPGGGSPVPYQGPTT